MKECFYAKFKTSLRFVAALETSENSLLINFQTLSVPFRLWPREASRLEAKTHEAEAKTHEAEAEATTHEAEAEAEARFFGLEAEARPRGLTSLVMRRKYFFLFQHNFLSSHTYLENPDGTRVIVGSMNWGVFSPPGP